MNNIFYRKNTSILKNYDIANVENIQNYIPLYENFFKLNNTNYNLINLNNNNFIEKIIEKKSDNIYIAEINDNSNNKVELPIFIKFSPLIDPIKYITNKYDLSKNLLDLPKIDNKDCIEKVQDRNNSAYIDGFFSYLTSILLNRYQFINSIDYYGSFLGIKNNFIYNIDDDIDILNNNQDFHKNNNKLYSLDNNKYNILFNNSTKNYKSKLNIDNNVLDNSILNLSNIEDLNCLDDIFSINKDNIDNIDNSNNSNINKKC